MGCSGIQRPAGAISTSLRRSFGSHGRHLRRDHAAHGMADEMRALEAELGDDVPAVQREVEHVLEQIVAARFAVARQLGSEYVILLGQGVEEGVLGEQPAGAVQEDQRRAAARLRARGPCSPAWW